MNACYDQHLMRHLVKEESISNPQIVAIPFAFTGCDSRPPGVHAAFAASGFKSFHRVSRDGIPNVEQHLF